MRTPKFWYQKSQRWAWMLQPLAILYQAGALLRNYWYRYFSSPEIFNIPVLCIGNFVAGGAGKTPVVMAITQLLKEEGWQVACVSRGYGRRSSGVLQVQPHSQYHTVGDEPLLLNQVAPTWVAHSRSEGIRAAIHHGADMVILDDGLQNPKFSKTFCAAVIDDAMGIGNGYTIPAGPLREKISLGLAKVDALIILRSLKKAKALPKALKEAVLPIFYCTTVPDFSSLEQENKKVSEVMAFAGIGFPRKFFSMMESYGYAVIHRQEFPDHHPYSSSEVLSLINQAASLKVPLVTTEKDWVRIPPELHSKITVVKIKVEWDDKEALKNFIRTKIKS